MIVLEGASALSPFRRDRLQTRLQTLVSGLRLIGAWHGYWIDPEPGSSPDIAAQARLNSFWPLRDLALTTSAADVIVSFDIRPPTHGMRFRTRNALA